MSSDKLIKAGLDVTLSAAGIPGVGSIVELVEAMIDPNKRARLDSLIQEHVLSELPRIRKLVEERAAAIEAAACTPSEVQIITYQVIEAQKRTLDENKRRLLTNTLVNGLCAKGWALAKHRLFVRLVEALEPEHVTVLREAADRYPVYQPARIRQRRMLPQRRDDGVDGDALRQALRRELIARGLLLETTDTSTRKADRDNISAPAAITDVSLQRKLWISPLGIELLAHLADPEQGDPGVGGTVHPEPSDA